MLHTKPQGHWPFCSGEEDFLRVFTIYGHGGHLGHVTQNLQTDFCSPIPLRLYMKFGIDWPSDFGKKIFENGGWTTDQAYSRERRDVTTWRVAKRRYQAVENKPLICIAV